MMKVRKLQRTNPTVVRNALHMTMESISITRNFSFSGNKFQRKSLRDKRPARITRDLVTRITLFYGRISSKRTLKNDTLYKQIFKMVLFVFRSKSFLFSDSFKRYKKIHIYNVHLSLIKYSCDTMVLFFFI